MTRTNAREIAVHFLFQLSFSNETAQEVLENQLTKEFFLGMKEESVLYFQYPNKKQAVYIQELVEGAFLHGAELDDYISRYAKNWSFARIPRPIAAILRVAMFEAMYMSDIPVAVAVNDALEIAKGYDDPEVISFMNGILGSFVRGECQAIEGKAETLVEEDFDPEEVAEAEETAEEITEEDKNSEEV